jgi:hypothetical protein
MSAIKVFLSLHGLYSFDLRIADAEIAERSAVGAENLAQPMAAAEQQKWSCRRGSHWCRRITSRQSKKGF